MENTNSIIIITFLFQIGVMLAIGLFFGQLVHKFNQPAVLGELIGGIVLGPTIFGFFLPGVYQKLFPLDTETTQAREAVIRMGMLFFMFVAGLEVNLSKLQQHKKSIVLVSALGCIVPFGLVLASNFLFPDFWKDYIGSTDSSFILFFGIALSISALPVITRILMDLRLLQQDMGKIVITAAAINDILGWSIFALLLNKIKNNNSMNNFFITLGLVSMFSILVLRVGRWIGKYLLKWARNSMVWPSGFLGVCAVMIFISAAISESINIHGIFGAFLVGIALLPVFEHNGADQAKEIIHQFAISLFAPLFFVSIGLKANFAASFDIQLVLMVIGLAIIGKVVGAGVGAWISGIELKDSLAIGFAMNARGAMEIILASVALDYGLIDQRIYVALVAMALVTSMMSGPIMKWILKMPKV